MPLEHDLRRRASRDSCRTGAVQTAPAACRVRAISGRRGSAIAPILRSTLARRHAIPDVAMHAHHLFSGSVPLLRLVRDDGL